MWYLVRKLLQLYVIGAIMVGAMFGLASETLTGTFMGEPLPYPRVLGGAALGVAWPYTLPKAIMRALDKGKEQTK